MPKKLPLFRQNPLSKIPVEPEHQEQQMFQTWYEIASPRVISFARPVRFAFGTLYIRVQSPHWMQELNFLKGSYREQLNAQLEQPIIRELRFELGELPPLPGEAQGGSHENPAWAQVELPPELTEEIEQQLSHLPENALKQSARRIMLNHYKITRMRQRNKRPRR